MQTLFFFSLQPEGQKETWCTQQLFDFTADCISLVCLRYAATTYNVKFGHLVSQSLAEPHYHMKNTVKPL